MNWGFVVAVDADGIVTAAYLAHDTSDKHVDSLGRTVLNVVHTDPQATIQVGGNFEDMLAEGWQER